MMLDNVYTLPFTVAAELRGTKASFDDLMRLGAGDLLRLDRRVGDPVDVSISDIVKFRGELASRDKRTAVLIQPLTDKEG
jgi:flagellar motor switch protein FliN/FliY